MEEPQLLNRSPFHASVLPILDREGAPSRIVIVKASYSLAPGREVELSDVQREARLGDEPWGAPEIPDLRLPSDFCAAKPGTDFVLSGHAVAHPGRSFVDVACRVANRGKVLRVHGPRDWRRSFGGVVPGPSQPLRDPTPLAWSRAYGGLDLSEPERPLEESRNPVGSGVARREERLIGTPAPQIEAPESPVGAAGGRCLPAGIAPLGRSFEPRRSAAGTYDAAWLRAGYPARPHDYREQHENCAAPGWVFETPLRGGERVVISGVHAAGVLGFALPKMRILVEAEIERTIVERRPHLDTVVVDSDGLTLEMVWRALFRCPAMMNNRFPVIRVTAKEFIG